MRELQTCDFCGGDPVGVYEPLPAGVAADQPRVALCAGCRDTLRRVLAPLDAGSGSGAADPGRGSGARDDGAGDARDADGDRPSASNGPASGDAPDADGDPPDADGAAGGSASDDSAAGGSASDDSAAGGSASDDSAAGGSASVGGSDAAAGADRPAGYRQVLRLVRNRDESLARDDLEALASNAYDVTPAEVRRAVDAAVENGDLEEADGGLRGA